MHLPSAPLALTGLGLAAMLLQAAWTDFRQRRVANRTVLGVAALWPAYLIVGAPAGGPALPLLLAGLTLGLGILLWRLGWLGGGDVKLLAALMLWAGPQHGLDLVVATALAGGALAVMALWYRSRGFAVMAALACLVPRGLRAPRAGRKALGARRAASLPYAVAIALGGLWATAPLFLA